MRFLFFFILVLISLNLFSDTELLFSENSPVSVKNALFLLDKTEKLNTREIDLLEDYHQTWTDSTWNNQLRDEYIYDFQYVLESIVSYAFMDTGWVGSQKSDFYFSNDILDSTVVYQKAYGNWQEYERYHYSYNEMNQIDTLLVEEWSDSLWVASSITEFTYDDSYFLLEETTSTYEAEEWIPAQKFVFDNNIDGNVIERIGYGWNEDDWNPQFKDTYVYENENCVEQTTYFYFNESWFQTTRKSNSWESDLLNNSLFESWDGTDWLNSTFIFYDYDTDDNNTRETTQVWQDSLWINQSRVYFVYGEITALDEDNHPSQSSFSCFPNPCNLTNSALEFSFPSIKSDEKVQINVFNLKGEKVSSFKKNISEKSMVLDFKSHKLPTGIYFIQVKSRTQNFGTTKTLIIN